MSADSWALITGASSGIGKEYARVLAARKINVILVARRAELLQKMADEFANQGVQTVVLALDLSQKENCHRLHQECVNRGLKVDYLINNAGIGYFDRFEKVSLEHHEKLIALNISAPTILTHLFLPDMLARNHGHIQFVASIASFMPTPFYATYGASKSYLRFLGVSLNYELKNTNVHFSVINPGVTDTEFFQVAGQNNSWVQRWQMMSARRCAEIAFRALEQNSHSTLPGVINWFTGNILTRFLPQKFQAKMIHDDLIRSNKTNKKLT